MRSAVRERHGPIGDGVLDGGARAEEAGGGGCCDHSQPGAPPRHTHAATVGVVGVGGAMVLCCAAPVLLSTGLLAAGAGLALGAGAVGVVGITVVVVGLRRILSRRIGVGSQSESRGPALPDGSDVDAPDSNWSNRADHPRKWV